MIDLVRRHGQWAASLRARHARRLEQRTVPMTVLERNLPVSLACIARHRPSPVLVAPRIAINFETVHPAVRVIEHRERELTVVLARTPGRVQPAPAMNGSEQAGPAAAQVALSRRYFVNRSLVTEVATRHLRQSNVEQESTTGTYVNRRTFEVAVEQAALLKRRLRREESTLAISVRQVRQNVIKSAPAQAPSEPAASVSLERMPSWPAPEAPVLPSLETITGHVIEQIDRKLVAHRERMGRI